MELKAFFSESTYAFCSECGLVRNNNEDSCLCLPDGGLFAVSDGIGGESGGEIASRIIVDHLKNSFLNLKPESSFAEREKLLKKSINQANLEIQLYGKDHQFRTMGATLTAFAADPQDPLHGVICQSGDSRLYAFHEDRLTQLTTDHTVYEEFRSLHPHEPPLPESTSHILTRAVGVAGSRPPEFMEVRLQKNTQLLLCSDGVYDMLNGEILSQVLKASETAGDAVAAIRRLVLERGATDNFTAVCIHPVYPAD